MLTSFSLPIAMFDPTFKVLCTNLEILGIQDGTDRVCGTHRSRSKRLLEKSSFLLLFALPSTSVCWSILRVAARCTSLTGDPAPHFIDYVKKLI